VKGPSAASPRAAAAIAAIGVVVLLVSSVPPPSRMFALSDHGDIKRYYHYAQQTFDGQVPYRDFVLEYPPGALPVFLGAGPADHGYFDGFRALMLALATAALVLLVVALQLVGASTAEIIVGVLVFATLPLTLHPELLFNRFDLWPAFLVMVALVALLRGRRTVGLAALGVGGVAKLYPLVLVPLAIMTRRGRSHVLREVAVVAAAALVFVLPFAILAPRGLGHVGKVLVERPLHVESLGASILLATHRLGGYEPTIYLNYFSGSWDLAGPAAKVAAITGSLAEAAALVAVWFLFARGPRGPRELLLAAAATVVGFVAFGKVFSPQYLVWVALVVPLALGRMRSFLLAATVGAALLTRYVYVSGYDNLLRGGSVSWVMLARNLLLVAVFAALVIELARARGSHELALSPFAPPDPDLSTVRHREGLHRLESE
jgi:hypothetical protein